MKNRDNRHVIDILFVLALFCTFVLSAIFLISIGANIYSNTMSNMDTNFISSTAVAYITEKIHQSDENDAISISNFDNADAITITQTINDIEYKTYIYQYEDTLRELTTRSEISLTKDAGQIIIPIKSFSVLISENNLLQCKVTTIDDENYDFNIAIHTGED